MSVSYKKLWKLRIDKDMKKKDLCEKAGISPASVTKMGRNGHVTTEILVKICAALDCGIEDIIEIVPDEKQPSNKAEPGVMRLFVRDCILLEQRILLVLSMLNFAVGVSVWIFRLLTR